jgi:hypothetical protein
MEVHHHPHVEKKSFKEYILEGLMIFVAVSMGFIAENIREHIVEKKQLKEYIIQLVNNLKYDTTRININTSSNITSCNNLDSFRYEILAAKNGHINPYNLYRYSQSYNWGYIVFNTSAISQLKNSGVFRLIENKTLVEKIDDYYDSSKIFKLDLEYYDQK